MFSNSFPKKPIDAYGKTEDRYLRSIQNTTLFCDDLHCLMTYLVWRWTSLVDPVMMLFLTSSTTTVISWRIAFLTSKFTEVSRKTTALRIYTSLYNSWENLSILKIHVGSITNKHTSLRHTFGAHGLSVSVTRNEISSAAYFPISSYTIHGMTRASYSDYNK